MAGEFDHRALFLNALAQREAGVARRARLTDFAHRSSDARHADTTGRDRRNAPVRRAGSGRPRRVGRVRRALTPRVAISVPLARRQRCQGSDESDQSTVARHSISTRAPSASPVAPNEDRAGLFPGKYEAYTMFIASHSRMSASMTVHFTTRSIDEPVR